MHGTPLATSSPIRSKIKQMGRRKAKNSRRSVSLLDVSVIDTNPEVSCQISESNETLASGYRDSGYVRSEASSLEEDDSKSSKDLVEALKFKDVLICELQESNRGLRLRCADAENKIWRLRVKCQSHCACCQVEEISPSPTDSPGEDKEIISTINSNLLTQDLFRFKRTQPFSTSSNDVNLFQGHDRLTNPLDRLAKSFSVRGNAPLHDSSIKPLTRSKSSGTIGTQTPGHRSLRRTDDQAVENLFALKVRQWQREHSLKSSPSEGSSLDRRTFSSSKAAELSTAPTHPQSKSTLTLSHRASTGDRDFSDCGIADGEASLLSVISERDSSLEAGSRKVLNPVPYTESLSSPNSADGLTNLLHQSTPFADITNQRTTSPYAENSKFPKALDCLQHFDLEADGPKPKDQKPVKNGWANSVFSDSVSGPPKESSKHDQFLPHEPSCGHCKCAQPSPVIIVPAGCCSCCKMANNPLATTPTGAHQHCFRASAETPKNQTDSHLKFDVSTDSSDLHPIFEMKSKTSFASISEFDSKTEHQAVCRNTSSYRDCRCLPRCSGLTVPLATRFDAAAEYKRKIEEGMKKFASDGRAETESLSFQPWTDCSKMSPQMKILAEASDYVNRMAIILNRATTRFHQVTGTPNPVNPSP